MNLNRMRIAARNKENFITLQNFSDFTQHYLEYISHNLQAVIVARNETNYNFFQYNSEGNYAITRPINSDLMLSADSFEEARIDFFASLKDIKGIKENSILRANINNFIYTCQQSIGATLDSLPAGQSNSARKINGDLFEHFIRLIIEAIGVPVRSGVVSIPVIRNDQTIAEMTYQHDIILGTGDEIKSIGSVKTSSKDRIDKIFIDKLTYNLLTQSSTPHFAIFLNDVQRKGRERNYGVNTTFLAGHFKAYSICLNPLDGVFYCDLRPLMKEDPFMQTHIKSLDYFFVESIWSKLS